MISRPKINFHIGLPKIAANLIHETAFGKRSVRRQDSKVITNSEYRQLIRPFVNDRSTISQPRGFTSSNLEKLKTELCSMEQVIASQHSLMGSPEHVIRADQMLPLASKRLANLSGVFHEFEMTFHVALRSQLSTALMFFREAKFSQQAAHFLDSPAQWFTLLELLSRACPNRQFVVWDFEDEILAAKPFVSEIFDLAPDDLHDAGYAQIREAIQPEVALRKIFSFEENLSNEERTEHKKFYQDDLNRINALPNVTVHSFESFA